MIKPKDGGSLGVGPFTYPPAIEYVSTDEYDGRAGGAIRVLTSPKVEVEKVLVTIESEQTGHVEHGVARWDSKKQQWVYRATANVPDTEDSTVTVTAVASPGHQITYVGVENTRHSRSIDAVCGGERRVAVFFKQLGPRRKCRKIVTAAEPDLLHQASKTPKPF